MTAWNYMGGITMSYLRSVVTVLALSLLAAPLAAQQRWTVTPDERAARAPEYQAVANMARSNSVWIEELTWVEIADKMEAGMNTVIVSTGGIEQNGPFVALGKHNYVLETACEEIARAMGNALCAPIIKLVPEGAYDPPTSHMRKPGTISLRQETFEAVLDDVATSLMVHGFDHIIFIGDSGGNQSGMAAVADRVNTRWGKTIAHHIPEYYDNQGVAAHMEAEFGITESSDGFHDSYWLTAMQMTTDPATVRYEERVAAGSAHINGVPISPLAETLAVGWELMQWRVDTTIEAIHRALSGM